MLKLLSIEFTNFKVFGRDTYIVNFNESDLMLLDGPNGYGKTSVFDAIELALTGTLKRLISTDGRQTPNDVVVAYDPQSDVIIDIVLSRSQEDRLSFRRRLKSPIPAGAQKISRFSELWDVFIKDEMGWVPARQKEIDNILENNNFIRDFHLFHYIQQEEAASFLKSNSETARATQISQLFGDTAAAEAKYSRLKNTEKCLASQRTKQLQKAELLRNSHSIDSTIHATKFGDVQHRYLLPWLIDNSKSPEWDLPEFEAFNQSKFSSFSGELDLMMEFVRNRDFYIDSLPYSIAYRSHELISDYICFYNSLDYISVIDEKKSIDQLFERSQTSLLKGIIPDNLSDIFDLLGRHDFQQFQTDQNTLQTLSRTSSGFKTIYGKIVAQHAELSDALTSLTEESRCPFCGKPHENHDKLEIAASIRVSDFSKLLSDQDKSILALTESIRTRFIEPVITQIIEFRTNNQTLPYDLIVSLKKANINRERLNKFHVWLNNCPFSIEDLMFPTLSHHLDAEKLSSSLEEVMRRIYYNTPPASPEYQVANEGGAFDRMFREYFGNRNDILFSLTEESIDQKRKYLASCFHSSFQMVLKDIAMHSDNARRLEELEQELIKISTKVLKKIRQYKKQLIGDIEIPFYIYSGKILQSHQSGIGQGVFLKDPTGGDELKNVRLVSNYKRDHDVLNTMSSGQISAVVISLTLALNKIYAKKFSPILIDDPVQTMDDINMSSLVELLRNEFPDRQIVLSTHEDKVAKYFVYKYLKYGRKVRQLNLMTEEEYDSLDNYIYSPVVG
jgi:DNA repair exonuclease SbcCD ATPase subunit